jgi:hypothetical protein
MNVLRDRINPETFVITKRQLAKYLKTDPSRVWRLESTDFRRFTHNDRRICIVTQQDKAIA